MGFRKNYVLRVALVFTPEEINVMFSCVILYNYTKPQGTFLVSRVNDISPNVCVRLSRPIWAWRSLGAPQGPRSQRRRRWGYHTLYGVPCQGKKDLC